MSAVFGTLTGMAEHKWAAVARSDVAVYVEIAWQGRLQRAWVPRAVAARRALKPRRG